MSEPTRQLDLPALDGANPLGFLTALGVLVTLKEAGESRARLGWKRGAVWRAYLSGLKEPDGVCEMLCLALKGRDVPADAESARAAAQKDFENGATRLKKMREAFKKRGLRGNQRAEAHKKEVEPIEQEVSSLRAVFLEKLSGAVSHLELSIGKKVDLSPPEFREKANEFLRDDDFGRLASAMLAGLAVEGCGSDRCPRTPFDFVDSSGRLAFLETARQLMLVTTAERLRATLFEPWQRADERWSLRFDPVEDRRYALLDRDPTAGDNKSRSEWMANLLAYRALILFPCTNSRFKAETAGWMEDSESPCFTWPIWEASLPSDSIRSLLGMPEFVANKPSSSLRMVGVKAVYRARRVTNGDYINFSPSFAVL